jgi:hypothetical protein
LIWRSGSAIVSQITVFDRAGVLFGGRVAESNGSKQTMAAVATLLKVMLDQGTPASIRRRAWRLD